MKALPWLREPLVHFLLAGGLLFVLASAWDKDDATERTIHIDREDLLVFMQGRAQVYDDATFLALLADMAPQERERLVRDVALQEALHREGESLKLSEADPLVRQRVVQQMRLLLMEEAAADMSVTEKEIRGYFERNKEEYYLPPSITFTHVYLPGADSSGQARDVLERLRRENVSFDRAGQYGERFLYQINYVDVSPDLVASHFGSEFASEVFGYMIGTWQGPARSDHGWHLVLLSRNKPGRTPDFTDVEANVRQDALAEKRQLAASAALDRVLERYRIVVDDRLGQ